MITMIKKQFIDMRWPEIEPQLILAIGKANGEMTIENVKARLKAGEMALAVVEEDDVIIASVTFEQRVFSSGKRILNVNMAGGESASEWIDEMNDLCDYLAKQYDCEEIYVIGRAGWAKKLKHLDFKLVHTVISRKVGE